ncbi:hypothetical protein T492DRAFT_1125806 [Pavlovales sp. CCMP2436]|nr:hypothetical protein T492DRAFT_1125806 [Pavlovales sp. CCMP2436]
MAALVAMHRRKFSVPPPMWGWTGRNTPKSVAALNGPTVSDREHELNTLERMAGGMPTGEMRAQGERDLASAYLADYKTVADSDMYEGFQTFLSGELGDYTTSKYVQVPYVDKGTRYLQRDPAQEVEHLAAVETRCIPWGSNHLFHIPGAHSYLEAEYRKRKQFDIYIGTLYALGPQTMDQAWHYYKYIVKGQQPTDREVASLMSHEKISPDGEERSDWKAHWRQYDAEFTNSGPPRETSYEEFVLPSGPPTPEPTEPTTRKSAFPMTHRAPPTTPSVNPQFEEEFQHTPSSWPPEQGEILSGSPSTILNELRNEVYQPEAPAPPPRRTLSPAQQKQGPLAFRQMAETAITSPSQRPETAPQSSLTTQFDKQAEMQQAKRDDEEPVQVEVERRQAAFTVREQI